MKPLLGSASGLSRAMICPASQVLPQVRKPPGESALRGTRIHKFLELAPEDLNAGFREAGVNARTCNKIDLTKVAGKYTPPHHREVAYIYDTHTAQCRVYQGIDRNYEILHRCEVPGTVDVVIPGFRMAEIWDYKTGRTDYGPPAKSPQLLFGALCTSLTLAPQATKFLVGFQYLRKAGVLECEYDYIGLEELEVFRSSLEQAVAKALCLTEDGVTAENVVLGDHCLWCPAKASCPRGEEVRRMKWR